MPGDEKVLLTAIIPVYNREEYLDKCIESVRNQTYQNLEIILVDDGSTGGSAGICDRYQSSDSRIQVIHQRNKGSISARMNGLVWGKRGSVAIKTDRRHLSA